ncbi:MAG: FG-GAP-like repeat-containing protein [Cyclobacteriaceae bacterium]
MQTFRIYIILALIFLRAATLHAQAPAIISIDKKSATVNEIVTISGSGFGTDASQLQVYFGAAAGEVVGTPSDNLIQAKVPAGATLGSISVTRLDQGLTAYSPQIFYLSYDGDSFDLNKLDGPYSYATSGSNLYNLCLCDFNLDGKVDIATSDTGNDKIKILQNTTSDIDTVSFTPLEFDINANTRWVRCGDLDGDGLPELVFSASNTNTSKDRIYIYKNNSVAGGTISFITPSVPTSLTLDGTLAARMDIKDMDGDGLPELVAVAISREGGVSVFQNTSSGGVISFNPSPYLPFTQFDVGTVELSSVKVEDLDNDGKAEIIASEELRSGLHIFKNSSSPGTISFSQYLNLSTPGRTTNLKVADFNGDGKPDLSIVNDAYVGVFRNTTSDGIMAFAEAVRFDQTLISREGIELADMDGNGLPDIIVATISNRLVVLLNKSEGDLLDFNTKRTLITDENTLSVRAGDLNGDGKPDLAYTETTTDKISIQLNRNCVKPVLEPQAGLGVCDVLPYQLSVTKAIGAAYVWESSADGNTFTPLAAAADSTSTFTTSNEAYYRVKLSSSHNGFACTDVLSNVVQVKRPEGFVPSKPTIIDKDPAEPVCFGDRIILRAQNVNARFFWTGPDGFTSNEQNPVIPNATKAKEGLYVLYVQASEENGGCVSDTATTFVKVSEPESISIQANSPTAFFAGGQTELSVAVIDGSTYSWKKDGQLINGATTHRLTVNEAGSYTAVIQNETGCTRESAPLQVSLAQPLIPESLCLNEALSVSVAPDSLNGQAISYRWDFGDGSSKQEGASAIHQFTAAGTYTITLEILRQDQSVFDTHVQQIEIIPIPDLILSSGNDFLCPEESILLEANAGFASYTWAHGATGPTTSVSEAGVYELTVTTEAGCTETASIEILDGQNPEAEITASTDRIDLGDTLRLQASGGVAYLWDNAASLSDSTIANPVARPLITTTYSCIVTNEQGCQIVVSYTINVDRTLDVDPQTAFTPNGDGRHDQWYIERMDLFPNCSMTLFDRQGSRLTQIADYSNAAGWDGTISGKPLPEGVYFYLIDCGDEAGRKTGSVTILR